VLPRERKSGAERREEIAGAAMRIIGERGLPALSTSALAAEVGVTTGALFRHFASQEEILRHATRNAATVIEGTFPDASLPAAERLVALARNRVRAFAGNPGLAWFVRSDQALLVLPQDAASRLRHLVERSRRFVLDAIRQGVREKSIRSDVEPEVLQILVLATIHALVGMSGVQRKASRPKRGTDDVLEGLMRVLAPQSVGRN
jgi:AcrR family transcriptional regulator